MLNSTNIHWKLRNVCNQHILTTQDSQVKGELNPVKNVGLNEYLREIKFCTGQESVDVVQRKKIFNDKNHYLFTYFKKCVLREDRSSYRPCYTFIDVTSAFTKTFLTKRRGTNV